MQEEFFRYMEENPMAGVYMEDDEIVEYDEVKLIVIINWELFSLCCQVEC